MMLTSGAYVGLGGSTLSTCAPKRASNEPIVGPALKIDTVRIVGPIAWIERLTTYLSLYSYLRRPNLRSRW
jgi:hypothetical protein